MLRKYKSATQDDLWHYLTQQAHKDGKLASDVTVKQIMDTWTLQTGVPVVTVERSYCNNSAAVKQERFLMSGARSDAGEKWWIPLTLAVPGGSFDDTYNRLWLKPTEEELAITGLPDSDVPVVFNVQETGAFISFSISY